jgi:hypothetical protein
LTEIKKGLTMSFMSRRRRSARRKVLVWIALNSFVLIVVETFVLSHADEADQHDDVEEVAGP